jgi:hypothetical protein
MSMPSVKPSAPLARPLSPWAGVLSYLVPGLGQIYQGRVAKGVLFLVCIYTLFFYGLYLGRGSVKVGDRVYTVASNVYLPDTSGEGQQNNPFSLPSLALNLYNRPQFAGQFWVGIVAWPAIWQYLHYDREEERKLQDQQARLESEFQSTEDAQEKEEKRREIEAVEQRLERGNTIFGRFERTPPEEAVNAVATAGDKRLELAWVYTVIAGVLNIMVIYDAIAGPAFLLSSANARANRPGAPALS